VVTAAYFMLVDRYGYAAYKVLSVSGWLIGRCLVEGDHGDRGSGAQGRPGARAGSPGHWAPATVTPPAKPGP
jgi:hypothetical protein